MAAGFFVNDWHRFMSTDTHIFLKIWDYSRATFFLVGTSIKVSMFKKLIL